jgi:hypothetical protein
MALETLQPGEKAPIITPPFHAAPHTPEQAAEGHSTTTMEFTRDVHLTVATNHTIFYPRGIHEVPDHLVNHWYLKANGARIYSRPIAAPARQQVTPQQPRQQSQSQQTQRQQNQRSNGR